MDPPGETKPLLVTGHSSALKRLRVPVALISLVAVSTLVVVSFSSIDERTEALQDLYPPIWALSGKATIDAVSVNGVNGQPIPDLVFRVETKNGKYIASPVQDRDGEWVLSVDAPMIYVVTATAPGYVDAKTIVNAQVDKQTDIRLVSVPKPGITPGAALGYVILEWGRLPQSLDGILQTPRCVVDPDSPRHCTEPYVKVTHDAVRHHGPDVIAIERFEEGEYLYRVTGLNELDPYGCDAKVTLHMPEGKSYVFHVSRDGFVHAPTWTVFRIFNGGVNSRWGDVRACRNEACRFGQSP
mmetsp:Transcript_36009/g.81991  ORF Transcript_36009/g.81991 Transcript_36009/m.81991 type:complete len:298 (-) Transcript_36009:162-1055(-)